MHIIFSLLLIAVAVKLFPEVIAENILYWARRFTRWSADYRQRHSTPEEWERVKELYKPWWLND